eukprot:g2286.t1
MHIQCSICHDKRGLLVDRQKRVMGKKKKKGGGKKKKKAVATSGDMTPEEKMQFLESQANYMERELAEQKRESRTAISAKHDLRREMLILKKKYEEDEKETMDVTKNMTRQYKCMQENLLKQITEAHHTIDKLKSELTHSEREVKSTKDEMKRALDEKDKKIETMENRMEEMANEFAEMLKETLEAMRERIEIKDPSPRRRRSGAGQRTLPGISGATGK